ncbi:MAG: type II toxin-antitoxin system PemK/MazF family toxin [bacterium]|nr:type II toxin-antitoxin system PemK/MazF family toxin [bacterium]
MTVRSEIYWADLGPPSGRRPVCVVTRNAAASARASVTCAPITRTIRGIRSEVPVGPVEGLPDDLVINCDNLITIPVSVLDSRPVGRLGSSGSNWTGPSAARSTSSTDPGLGGALTEPFMSAGAA